MNPKEDWQRMALVLETEDEEGLEIEIVVKAHAEVCTDCNGKGKTDHPAFANGITSEEWEHDWDEDSREGYLEGRYDVTCTSCKGKRVVLEADESDPNYAKLVAWWEEESAYRRECEMERRMGC